MDILVTNDDGIHSAGLQCLAKAAERFGTVWIVAPQEQAFAQSHALTFHHPLRVRQDAPRSFAVAGTPADCVFMALNALLPKRPALLLSGINRGSNVGDDVHYSGTAAAALEGGLQGIPSLAVSLDVDWARSPDSYQWECAAEIASEVISTMLKRNVPGQTVLNLNVPDLPRGDIRGVKVCRLGSRIYEAKTSHGEDLRWQPYYWIGTVHMGFRPIPNSDGPLLKDGYATLTPLSIDLTDNATLERMSTWELG